MAKAKQLSPDKFEPHPTIKELEDLAPNERIVQLDGFLGHSTEETVRLYPNLNLSEYWEIPKNNVLKVTSVPDEKNEGRVRLLLLGSTTVTAVAIKRESIAASTIVDAPRVLERQKLPSFMHRIADFVLLFDDTCYSATRAWIDAANKYDQDPTQANLDKKMRAMFKMLEVCGSIPVYEPRGPA